MKNAADYPRSQALFKRNEAVIPGGVVSLNRSVTPRLAFEKGRGSRVFDVDGNEYIDFHAGFAPYLLGHNDPDVNAAVRQALDDGLTLMGSGTNEWEGRLASLIVDVVASVDKVELTNTGSEATYHAIRIARAHTGRNGVIVMQGGYNGWHNDVALNVMSPLEKVGPRVAPGEYPKDPLSAGIPQHVLQDLHPVNFNDLDSVEYVCKRHEIAAIILEPILQNIGVVKPKDGYLQGLREICDREGVVLIFDEVKTGFRHALGGYQSLCGVRPDLSVFGKALANGYPIGAVGGRAELMDYFNHPDASRRVLIAGTYNAHPLPTVAAVATIEKLRANEESIYGRLEELGQQLERGLIEVLDYLGVTGTLSRQGSALCLYFMDHAPADWHDLAAHHDFELDSQFRQALIAAGIYVFPLPTKQVSISYAHTGDEVALTVQRSREALAKIRSLTG